MSAKDGQGACEACGHDPFAAGGDIVCETCGKNPFTALDEARRQALLDAAKVIERWKILNYEDDTTKIHNDAIRKMVQQILALEKVDVKEKKR